MTFARVFWPLVFTAAIAACSGNLGGGQSTLPGAPQSGMGGTNVQQVASATATPTPSTASNVATIGDTAGPQPLPEVMGYTGSIAFAQPSASPSPAPNAKSTAAPGAANSTSTSVGITASTIEPTDAPHFGGNSGKRHAKHDPNAVTPLLFITLLATTDVTLGEYPKIAVDVPREVAAKHRDEAFALALFDPDKKDKSYQLAVAERDMTSPPPGSYPSASPSPAPTPTATPYGINNGPGEFTPPPVGSGLSASPLPAEHVAFNATAATLMLKANRPVVFALYAAPAQSSPSPSPAVAVPSATASAASGAPASSSPAAKSVNTR